MKRNISHLKTVYRQKLVDWHDEEIQDGSYRNEISFDLKNHAYTNLLEISGHQVFIEGMETQDIKI